MNTTCQKQTNTRDEATRWVDISLKQDGGVLKRVLAAADGQKEGHDCVKARPTKGCPCVVQFTAWCNEKVLETTRNIIDGKYAGGTDDPLEFYIFHGEVTQGFDIAVASMAVGETARFLLRPPYARAGGAACKVLAPPPPPPGEVEPEAGVELEVELVGFGAPVPRPPSAGERAALAAARRAQEEADAAAHPNHLLGARLARAEEERARGNAAARGGRWAAAKGHYDQAFVHVYTTEEDWARRVAPADRERLLALRRVLYLNRAQCRLKLGHPAADALWDCDQALKLGGPAEARAKGHYRRARVWLARLEREAFARAAAGAFWDPDKARRWLAEAEGGLAAAAAAAGEGGEGSPAAAGAALGEGPGRPGGGGPAAAGVAGEGQGELAGLARAVARARRWLGVLLRGYRAQERELYRDRIVGRLGQGGSSGKEKGGGCSGGVKGEEGEGDPYAGMPALEGESDEEGGVGGGEEGENPRQQQQQQECQTTRC